VTGQTWRMSPVSRGRKRKRNGRKIARGGARSTLPDLSSGPEHCDCPACSGEGFDPDELIDALVEEGSSLLEIADSLDAEIAGASLVRFGGVAQEGFQEAWAAGLVPAIAQRASTEALAVLLAIGSVAPPPAGEAASAAADRLIEAGVARPGWANELAQPVEVTECRLLADPAGSASILVCSFRRAGYEHGHAFVVAVDHEDCGAAASIMLTEHDEFAAVLAALRSGGGVPFVERPLEPAELRWQVENALDARAHHDLDDDRLDDGGPAEWEDPDDADEYPLLAELLAARMRALPALSKPKPPHSDACAEGLAALAGIGLAEANELGLFDPPDPQGQRWGQRPPAAKLPAKRPRSAPRAPIYQIKVGLRDSKPPIWRRLELPADASLATLHRVIQIAFGWEDDHLHIFETPYGEFGVTDADQGVRPEKSVTLEQVAPKEGDTLRYTYDLGDNWEHDVLVERAVDREEMVRYPRCTGGRRAGPPEDCGGIWGYQQLLEVLADPSHPDHEDQMEWLGLDDPGDLDPARFDADEVTQAIVRLR